jgi:hypothetical protein
MSPSKKHEGRSSAPGLPESPRKQPRTLLQRLSSGLTSMMPNIPLRRGTSKQNLNDRPRTAPGPTLSRPKTTMRSRFFLPDRPEDIPQINIPTLSKENEKCPYDPSEYHSIPTIESSRCDFCGLIPPSRAAFALSSANNPCYHCRSRSPLAHITSSFKRFRRDSRSNSTTQDNVAQLVDSSSSSDVGPRPVSAAIAASRIGNPPRRASMPHGFVATYNTFRPSSKPPAEQERHASKRTSIDFTRQSSTTADHSSRPISPKLHYLDVLPGSKSHPFVYKREVEAHLAALRAGAPSPLRPIDDEVRSAVDPKEPPVRDYSRTVFYGRTVSRNNDNRRSGLIRSISPPHTHAATTIYQRVEASSNIVIEEGRRGGRPLTATLSMELERSSVYRRRTPQPRGQAEHHPRPYDSDSDGTFSTLTTQTPSTVGGKRLELKGGADQPQLRLRGGSGTVGPGLGFKFKKWLLTCHGPCRIGSGYSSDSDDDLPPARPPTPERIARAYERAHGRVSLPAYISRGTSTRASAKSTAAGSFVESTSGPSTRLRRLRDHLPGRREYPESPINLPRHAPLSADVHNAPSTPLPRLRGGAGPSEPDRLPPTLFWLAGGRGKPITMSSWNKQKPKKRMGGLLGMALYGRKAGTAYETGVKPAVQGAEKAKVEGAMAEKGDVVPPSVEEPAVAGTPDAAGAANEPAPEQVPKATPPAAEPNDIPAPTNGDEHTAPGAQDNTSAH